MVMFAFFLTTFVRRARVGILIGIFVFVIGLLFESFVFSSNVLGYIWWDQSTSAAGWIGECCFVRCLLFVRQYDFGFFCLNHKSCSTADHC